MPLKDNRFIRIKAEWLSNFWQLHFDISHYHISLHVETHDPFICQNWPAKVTIFLCIWHHSTGMDLKTSDNGAWWKHMVGGSTESALSSPIVHGKCFFSYWWMIERIDRYNLECVINSYGWCILNISEGYCYKTDVIEERKKKRIVVFLLISRSFWEA